MAQPLSANPFPLALLFALLAVAAATSRDASWRAAALAGVLTGAAAALRLDFGAYAAAACIVAVALRPGDRGRRTLAFGGALAGVVLVAYAPFFAAAGPGDAWDALVAKSLREREWWTLPFPFSYDGGLGSLSDAKDVLDFYVPLILVVGAAVAAAITVANWLRDRVGRAGTGIRAVPPFEDRSVP